MFFALAIHQKIGINLVVLQTEKTRKNNTHV